MEYHELKIVEYQSRNHGVINRNLQIRGLKKYQREKMFTTCNVININ